MTPIRTYLSEIKEREAKSTPGPWTHAGIATVYCGEQEVAECYISDDTIEFAGHNGNFIAHSRQDIPTLLKLVETMSEALEKTDCSCDAGWSGIDEEKYRAAGCPNCVCPHTLALTACTKLVQERVK